MSITLTLHSYGSQEDCRVAKAIRQAEMAPFEGIPSQADADGPNSVLRWPKHEWREARQGKNIY